MINKKAQLYIFTAIILCSLVFGFVAPKAFIRKPDKTFTNIHKNYMDEAYHVINSAIVNNANVTSRFNSFTLDFLRYTDTKKINFQMLYILTYRDKMELYNSLGNILFSTTERSFSMANNRTESFDKTDVVTVAALGESYEFNITNESIQLKAIFRAGRGDEQKVFVYG